MSRAMGKAMTDMALRAREVIARGDVLIDEEVLAMAREIEALRQFRSVAGKLASLMANPLRADDGEYDYDAEAVDAALSEYYDAAEDEEEKRILAMSEEEILAEAHANGDDPRKFAEKMREFVRSEQARIKGLKP